MIDFQQTTLLNSRGHILAKSCLNAPNNKAHDHITINCRYIYETRLVLRNHKDNQNECDPFFTGSAELDHPVLLSAKCQMDSLCSTYQHFQAFSYVCYWSANTNYLAYLEALNDCERAKDVNWKVSQRKEKTKALKCDSVNFNIIKFNFLNKRASLLYSWLTFCLSLFSSWHGANDTA